MAKDPAEELIDYDELKRNIVDAIRTMITEDAAERGISEDEWRDRFFGVGVGGDPPAAKSKGEPGMTRRTRKLIHEGKYAAEVEIELHYSDERWSPTMSLDDARKLDTVRLVLSRGDLAEAAKYGQVYEMTPVSA